MSLGAALELIRDEQTSALRTDTNTRNRSGAHQDCEDNTSKDTFSQCEHLQNLQGIHIQVKSEYVGTLTTSEVMTRMQSDKHNNMFNAAANLKHVHTHENIN